MGKRLAVVATILGLGVGTLFPGTARADSGVASDPPATGHARACAAHAENQGKSYANGVHCATLVATFVSWGGGCSLSVIGTGLQPGSFVDAGFILGSVSETGTFFGTTSDISCDATVSGTTASGTPITATRIGP